MLKCIKRLIPTVIFLLMIHTLSYAQSGVIDTIIVDLTKDNTAETKLKQDTLIEVISTNADGKVVDRQQKILNKGVIEKSNATPSLDLSLLKKNASPQLDTIAIIKKTPAKETVVSKTAETKQEEIIAKQAADRAKALAKLELEKQKRIEAKEAREAKKIALDKERAEKATLKKELEAKAKKDEKIAQQKEKALAKQKQAEEKQKKQEELAEKKREALAAKEKEAKEKAAIEQEKETEKLADKAETETQPIIIEEDAAPQITTTNDEIPKAPEGIEQKDNDYGTVRLAYDDLATSFLLTIPTETKMHYHANHSEHILLVEGKGLVLIGYKTVELRPNELIFVTKGTPHKIINKGKTKLKVLSIQSPFYAGKDIVILE